MAVREYVGARYVPLFADEPWTNTNEYERQLLQNASGG